MYLPHKISCYIVFFKAYASEIDYFEKAIDCELKIKHGILQRKIF